jgi:hypothetical protein
VQGKVNLKINKEVNKYDIKNTYIVICKKGMQNVLKRCVPPTSVLMVYDDFIHIHICLHVI